VDYQSGGTHKNGTLKVLMAANGNTLSLSLLSLSHPRSAAAVFYREQ
jgi:hypothetical protein